MARPAGGRRERRARRGDRGGGAIRLLGGSPGGSRFHLPFDRLRAEAAIALAEGDIAGARERIERARAVLPADDAFRRALLEQMTEAAVAERASA